MKFTNELIKIKSSKMKTNAGDVFIIQPKDSLYIYGRVIRTDIKNFGNLEWNLIYIYDEIKRRIDESYVLDPNKLLIPPQIVNNQGWIKGYFYTVGNKPLTTSDYARNYGFWDTLRAIYVDEDGVPMNVKPSMYTDYGLGSYGIVGLDVQKALEKKNII